MINKNSENQKNNKSCWFGLIFTTVRKEKKNGRINSNKILFDLSRDQAIGQKTFFLFFFSSFFPKEERQNTKTGNARYTSSLLLVLLIHHGHVSVNHIPYPNVALLYQR